MMSVNVSSRQFHVQYFIHKIETFTSKNPVLPNMLEMEITESVLMENQQSTIVALKTLSKLGFKITIDDFGTGYSSLCYLRRFMVDTLILSGNITASMCRGIYSADRYPQIS